MREDRAARAADPPTRVRAAAGRGRLSVVRDRVHQHGPVVHHELAEVDGQQGAKTVGGRARCRGRQQDHGQSARVGRDRRWRQRRCGRPSSGRAPEQPVQQRGRGQLGRDGGNGGRGGGQHHEKLVPEDIDPGCCGRGHGGHDGGPGDGRFTADHRRRTLRRRHGKASRHHRRRRRVRSAKVPGRGHVRRRTAQGVATRTGRVQTGKTTDRPVVAAATAAATAAAAAVATGRGVDGGGNCGPGVGRQETGRSGVGPAHRIRGERRSAGHGHRRLSGSQEVGRQRRCVTGRRRTARRRQTVRGRYSRQRTEQPRVRYVHLFVAQRPVRQIAIRPLVSADRDATTLPYRRYVYRAVTYGARSGFETYHLTEPMDRLNRFSPAAVNVVVD